MICVCFILVRRCLQDSTQVRWWDVSRRSLWLAAL